VANSCEYGICKLLGHSAADKPLAAFQGLAGMGLVSLSGNCEVATASDCKKKK
jgi:hypothetical protein